MITLKSLTTDKLTKKEILEICNLKNTFWKYGLKSNINWFKNNVKNKDITMRNFNALVVKLVDTKDLKSEGFTK